MTRNENRRLLVGLALVLLFARAGGAAESKQPSPAAQAKGPPAAAAVTPRLDPKAIALLQAMSQHLAAAHTLAFTAVSTEESPTRHGPPLAYTTRTEVTLERPDKLRVITTGDGPASEFYYDGKTMTAFAPAENLVAVADAPPTIDAALEAAYHAAAIYFPFTDVLVADPYKDLAEGMRLAYYIGQSHVVGGTTTDMVALASDRVFAQVGSAPTTNCRGWCGRSISTTRRGSATRWSSPTGSWMARSPRMRSHRHAPQGRPVSSSRARIPSRRRRRPRAPRRRRNEGEGDHHEDQHH